MNLLGAAQALLLALVLVSVKRGNRTANRILAAFAATISILITWAFLNSTHSISQFPHLLRINHPFDFVAGPLLYLYVRALTSSRPEVRRKDLLHFIPFGLAVLYLLPYYFQSREVKLRLYYALADMQWYYVRSSLALLLALVYFVFIGFMIARYLRTVKEEKSPAVRAVISQIKLLSISFVALWLAASIRHLSDVLYPEYIRFTNLVLPSGATIFIYAMAYFGLRTPETLIGSAAAATDAHPPTPEPEALMPATKYEKSTLTSQRSEQYLTKLLAVMARDKPYMDGDLSLPKLATKLSVSAHHLSQIINERLNQNFFDFVNTYRVEEAKRMLLDPAKRHYSLLAIAEEVGFNSKSAFNMAFKKQTNMTPSGFRKNGGDRQHLETPQLLPEKAPIRSSTQG